MAVIRELQFEIARALRMNEFEVRYFGQSSSNWTLIIFGQAGVFFAKIFTTNRDGGATANHRYAAEKAILSARNLPIKRPVLRFFSDPHRLLITEAVNGHGYRAVLKTRREMVAAERLGKWVGSFHNIFPVQKTNSTIFELMFPTEKDLFRGKREEKSALLAAKVNELVFSKSDTNMDNFKFTDKEIIGLDFEYSGFRPVEYDLSGIIASMAQFSEINVNECSKRVMEGYRSAGGNAESRYVDCSVLELLVDLTTKIFGAGRRSEGFGE